MKSVCLVCVVIAAAGCTAVTRAQSATAPARGNAVDDTLSRISRWFGIDWSIGWQTGSTWRLVGSPYTYHFSPDPGHRHVYMLGLERRRADGLLVGGTAFRNSFGQPSSYVYIGQRFDRLAGIEPLFADVTGGLLYGYKPPYDHKVPLNYRGFSPGLVPSLGWKITPTAAAQLNFLGTAALMFQFSVDFR